MPPDARPMKSTEFKAVRETLGLSPEWLARYLGVAARTVRHWDAGRYPIPAGVQDEIEQLEAVTREAVTCLAAQLSEAPDPRVVTYRSDSDVTGPRGLRLPARWHRVVCGMTRLLYVPGLPIVDSDSANKSE